ncbi:hypothetical protein [Formosa algae]|uniref:Uncharacterized protein n=1 Tax=Formosa algae TaxID=225843 RepID=A0A9X0YR43_9FLAO|nr:hypothetical protein [Formosa algae]MBP1841686.1 hypothetical protein [Formosa algae]MDQ0337113.1 hypothetical protein [Formosa algae]OEI80533.1 hypothetical protein AST99_08695 [Formosa algae]
MSYKEEISGIVEEKLIDKSDIFDYFETPFETLCNKIYLYYKKLIENNSDLYNIEPNFFFFKNNTTINASAYIKENNTLTSINIGTIHKLKSIFLDSEELTNEIFGESIQTINQILIEKESSVMEFMYYSAIIFLMNHEIGHLIQNNGKSEKHIHESINEAEDFNIENHIYEVDSDIFASMKLTQDIHQVWLKFDDKHRTDEFLCDLISLASSAIGIFKLFNLNAVKEVYFKEKSHPHVAVRFIIIQENIVNYISHIRKSEISEEYRDTMMLNSFGLIETLNKFHKDSFFDNFTKTVKQHSDKLEEYGIYLTKEVAKNENCAYYKMKALEK